MLEKVNQAIDCCLHIQALLEYFLNFFWFILFLSHTKICIFMLVTERRFLNIFE